MKKYIILVVIAATTLTISAQTKWHDPQIERAKLHGRALTDEHRTNFYQRLPDRVQSQVREAVWSLSTNTAGESLQFYTNSPKIIVRYTVTGGHSMPHMPATGKSGVDLYAYDNDGVQKWCAARYNFDDTITYRYEKLMYNGVNHGKGYEYHLYLPPYNGVKWLSIGVDSTSYFKFIEPSVEKPIIAYGTSITQGACASRPGMIWPSIVAREMSSPLINLGFSGNGKLEKGILDVIKATPASVVILDCMPNLMNQPQDTITKLVINAVNEIRTTQPSVPILIVDHLGYPHSQMIAGWKQHTDNAQKAQAAAFNTLTMGGAKEIYYLSYDEIAMPQDATVEAIHPSDYGMRVYADAYVKKLRKILNQPIGTLSTENPVTQRREPDTYEWRERHDYLLRQVAANPPKVVLLGNSITHYWGGVPGCIYQRDTVSWNAKIAPLGAINMGCGWDRVENVLWRVRHGALSGYAAQKVIVAIGINNIMVNKDREVAPGIKTLINAIANAQPQAQIIIQGIYPARGKEDRVAAVNKEIARVAKECGVIFKDFGSVLLDKKGKINEMLFTDGLHPNESGYRMLVDYVVD